MQQREMLTMHVVNIQLVTANGILPALIPLDHAHTHVKTSTKQHVRPKPDAHGIGSASMD